MDRRRFLLSLAGAATFAPQATRARAAPAIVGAALTIDGNDPGRAIPADFTGLSYESGILASPDYFSPDNRSVVGLLRGLGGHGVLRFGGNASERTFWRAAGPTTDGEDYVITPTAIDALAGLLEEIDWRLIYGLNLARGTPEAAAEEAAYVAGKFGKRLLAFQIGNEPDGFAIWAGERQKGYDVSAYIAEWRRFHDAIRARVPDAPFAGPAIAGEAGWLRAFVDAEHDDLVLVTRHFYADGPARAPYVSIDRLLHAAAKFAPVAAETRAISAAHGLPFRIAEANSVFMEGHPGVSDTFASALWGLEFMFEIANAGGAGVNFHTGDAKAYTPIAPAGGGRHSARPLYYGMLMFKEAVADAKLVPARLDAAGLNLAAYSTRAPDGTLRACLINKDLGSAARVRIDAGRRMKSATAQRLTAPAIDATAGVLLAGSAVDDLGIWAPKPAAILSFSEQSVFVPPGSAVLVTLSEA